MRSNTQSISAATTRSHDDAEARDGKRARRPLVAPIDVAVIVGLPLLTAVAWTVPETRWRWIARPLAPFARLELTNDVKSAARRIRAVFGDRVAPDPDRMLLSLAEENLIAHLQLLRHHRPGSWRPAIELVGREHIDRALAAGRGAVLWIGRFVHAGLVAKMAWRRASLAVAHLSKPGHGYSDSVLGTRVLNRVLRRAEDRYLDARVMMAFDNPVAALRALYQRLERNALVSVAASEMALRPVRVGFLDGAVTLASGGADLAYASGAALLPVFAIRRDGGFRVTVHPPLPVDRSRTRTASSERALESYVALLETYCLDHPEQWLDLALL